MTENNKNVSKENIISVQGLSKAFNLEAGFFARDVNKVYAVNNVTFDLKTGQTYGIVGESGCGKTTTARLLIQMYKQNSGNIFYSGDSELAEKPVEQYSKKQLRKYREQVKYIFQDPARSLNPRLTVFDCLIAGLRYSSMWQGKDKAYELCSKIITEVGLSPEDLNRRPAEFSGGQRQRISIARGLIMNPKVLICDEVVSALDVSIQGQIINLLQDLRKSRNLSYIFITHDLKVASYFCDSIGVMFRGIMVEEAPADNLYQNSRHPYTQLLFEGAQGKITNSNVEVKTTLVQENCCPFAYRCPKAKEKCKNALPEFKEIAPGHKVRCFELES